MTNHLLKEPSGNYEDMKKVSDKDSPMLYATDKIEFDYPYLVKKPYKHSTKTRKGNFACSKHKFHRGSDTLLEVTVPAGIIDAYRHSETFNMVGQAKEYIRRSVPFLKDSALTNISSAVNGTGRFKDKIGHAYGLRFRNVTIKGNKNKHD